jgi:hypothetical protein
MTLRLGKLPARIDNRTIPLKAIIRKKLLPPLPEAYDLHEAWQVQDNFMFLNDVYGDCVKAARAHQTLVLETIEQGKQIDITDQEVEREYFHETGGPDTGLYLLNSIKDWRNRGWPIGDRNYTIYAFASANWRDHEQVKHCIHLLGGVNFGMMVFTRDIQQFEAGQPWTLTPFAGTFEGGHGVYLCGYGPEGVTCTTWGRRQRMSWDFWDARVDEAYAVVDNRDDWVGNSPIDVTKLDAYLKEITHGEIEPSTCPFANAVCWGLDKAFALAGRKSRFKSVVHRHGL